MFYGVDAMIWGSVRYVVTCEFDEGLGVFVFFWVFRELVFVGVELAFC